MFFKCINLSWAVSRNVDFIEMNCGDVLFVILLQLNNLQFQAGNIGSYPDSALILPVCLSRPPFFIHKIKESNLFLFKTWSSSQLWFYFKRFERKNSPAQITTKPLTSLLQNQSLITFLFHVNTLCPRSINIITWWFKRLHRFYRRS